MEQTVKRAKELLQTVRHAAMATVNEDGSPHNTPYRFMIDDSLENVYWGSHPESKHSRNIARTGQVFIVLFEANQGGGLYIEGSNAHELSGEELDSALIVHNTYRKMEGKEPIPTAYYQESEQRMYSAKVSKLWVNYSVKDEEGRVSRDLRQEINKEDLQ